MLSEIAPGIFSWKNYLSQEELDQYFNLLENCPEESWYFHGNLETGDISGEFLDGKLSLDIVYRPLHAKIIDYFATKKMWIFCHGNFLRLKAGEGSEIKDSCTDILQEYLPIIQDKLAIYMSEFEGGEIVFPKINFEYKPEAGEMLVIKVDRELEHYTKPVTSGVRYAYMDYLVKHPGYYMP
jgi:hypothetical protein